MQDSLAEELERVIGEAEQKRSVSRAPIPLDIALISATALLGSAFEFVHLGYLVSLPHQNQTDIAYSAVNASALLVFSLLAALFAHWLVHLPWKLRVGAVHDLLEKGRRQSNAGDASLQRVGKPFETPTFRNDAWINVANTFIQRGDRIQLQAGRRAPARVQRVRDGLVVERDDLLPLCLVQTPALASFSQEERVLRLLDVEEFCVLESPLVSHVSSFLFEAVPAQETELGKQLARVDFYLRLVALAIALVVGVLIGGLAHEFAEEDWALVFLVRPITLLCLFPALSWPLFRLLVELYWERRMRAVCSSTSSSSALLPSTLLHVMGTVTTLCNLDEETLLQGAIVEEIFALTTKEYKILDCCWDAEEASLRFEDPHWKQYLDVLRPIGLTCALATSRPSMAQEDDLSLPRAAFFLKHDALRHFAELAQAMMIDKQAAAFQVHSRLVFVEDEEQTIAVGLANNGKKRSFECLLVKSGASTSLGPESAANAAAPPESYQLLCFGDSSLLLKFCTDYWNGESIAPLEPTSEVRAQTEAMIRQWDKEDLVSTAFAYAPLLCPASALADLPRCSSFVVLGQGSVASEQQQRAEDAQQAKLVALVCETLGRGGQVFTGMVGSPDVPKAEITALVETLWTCGIRFVYFSPRDTRKTRKIAEKMGLDTDWNTSISLSSSCVAGTATTTTTTTTASAQDGVTFGADTAVAWELKARLPRGIEAIRTHIQSVDDVPLRVSVFTETSPDTVSAMLGIMREWEEVVAVYGSPLCGGNGKAFLRANASIAILPRHSEAAAEAGTTLAMDFAKLPCAFTLFEDEIPLLLSLLGEGRVALYNYRQANQLYLALSLVAMLSQAVVFCASNTQVFTLGHALWLAWVQIPLVAASPALRPRSKQEMLRRRMPWKRSAVPNLPSPHRRYAVYLAVRLVPCILLVCALFFWALNAGRAEWSWNASSDADELVTAQCIAMFALVWCANCVAFTFASRTKTRVEFGFGVLWTGFALATLALQLVYNCVFAQITTGACAAAFQVHFPDSAEESALWLVLLLAPPILIPLLAFPVKRHDATFDLRAMRMLRLDFETKLGQFSPK